MQKIEETEAMELNKDKQFTLEDVILIAEYVRVASQSTPNERTKNLVDEYLSTQPIEIEVEIKSKIAHKSIYIMLNAYRNGDKNLDQFPDSIEKQTLLETISKWKSEMSNKRLSSEEISELKEKLNSSNEVEQTRIILDIVDNYDISSDELKEIFTDHKELLSRIRKLNKNS
jgi:hypothetical protein